ncbi:MAG: hypothetical protein K2X54_07965 [Methylobacterium organophilum]|jgi:hypothetical protein|nr:hypothetical protein [Methylobacterium organophilum]
MTRTLISLALILLAAHPARANPPVDETKAGACLELKLDGRSSSCNHDFRLVDDGAGEVSFVTGYGDGRLAPKKVLALFTAQTSDMENTYGYALRLTNVTLMTYGQPDSQRMWKAAGLCFMVKPNPVRAGAAAIRQDIVVMCSASLADAGAPVRKIDWKFVF